MKTIIATEEILNEAGTHIIAIVYHYEDGSTSKTYKVFKKVQS